MSEVLSQEEIDALLGAINRGEVDAEELKQEQTQKRVRVYDFRRLTSLPKSRSIPYRLFLKTMLALWELTFN